MKLLFCFLSLVLSTNLFSQEISLRDVNNQYDYIIITIPEYRSECEPFKVHKELIRNYKVLITDTTQILNEFDSSLTKENNIKDFISFSGTYWKTPQPKYFLIAGNLDQIPNFTSIRDLSFVDIIDTVRTDYYYSINKYESDTTIVDFYVGRVSANNNDELQNYFNKVIKYETDQSLNSWTNNTLFNADDGITAGGNEGNIFENTSYNIAKIHPNRNIKYIFQSDTSIYAGNRDSIISYINNQGVSSVFFIGHGNNVQFTHEDIFNINDIDLLKNENKYFISFYLSKNEFSTSQVNSITNKMITSKYGSIAGFNPVGFPYFSISNLLANSLYRNLYSDSHLTIGEVVYLGFVSKNNSDNFLFNLSGDPSIKLKYDILADNDDNKKSLKPNDFSLAQNFPNPFNPVTVIKFSLPVSGEVELKLYDVLGNEINTLIKRYYNAGSYEYKLDASDLPSGVYLYQIKSGSFMQTKKMVLMK